VLPVRLQIRNETDKVRETALSMTEMQTMVLIEIFQREHRI